MFQYLNLLCVILLDAEIGMWAIVNALSFVGYAFIFRKCGQAAWKAAVPVYREYALAQCADREMEGRVLFICKLLNTLSAVALSFGLSDTLLPTIGLGTVDLLIQVVVVIYTIRVYFGLFTNFKARKWWIVPVFVIPFIPTLTFGLAAKYQPQWKVPEIDKDEKEYFHNAVSTLDNGLTVNLEERVAREFLKKSVLLRDIHMNIRPGRMVLLLGGSGAGKTTLLNAIIGYEKAKAEVTLDGKNVYREYKQMQYEIGFVPQQDLMRGNDTLISTLSDAAALRLPQNFSRAERAARVKEVMDIFGLTPSQTTLLDKMSGGQRKRVSIAMEFLSNPTLFILDEPDSGLDGIMARELMQQLRRIADQGKIVIVITHTPDRVIDLFDDVIVLAKDSHRTGRLAYYGSIDEAKTFFEREHMEEIVKTINSKSVGGEGRADEFVKKFSEVQNG